MSGCRTAKISLVLGISVASAVLAGHGPQGGQAAPPEPFSPGETLMYDLSWQIFPAGEVVATLTKKGEDAKDAYEVKATGTSRGFVSLLYTVHDEFTSVFDPHTVCSESISKKINRSEEHTSELQSRLHLVCRLLLEKKKKNR